MAKVENVDVPGVFQLENGLWGYRFTITVNGKKKDVKKTKDDFGKPFKTARSASRARVAALAQEKVSRAHKPKMKRMTVREVYQEYAENGRKGKA